MCKLRKKRLVLLIYNFPKLINCRNCFRSCICFTQIITYTEPEQLHTLFSPEGYSTIVQVDEGQCRQVYSLACVLISWLENCCISECTKKECKMVPVPERATYTCPWEYTSTVALTVIYCVLLLCFSILFNSQVLITFLHFLVWLWLAALEGQGLFNWFWEDFAPFHQWQIWSF